MPKNSIVDQRNHLFETLESLKDKDEPMPLDRAKAVVEVAQTIINSAKVEVEFMKAIDSGEVSQFFDMQRVEQRRSLNGASVPEVPMRRLAR